MALTKIIADAIEDNAVTTVKIVDGAVTAAKLASGAATPADASITPAKLSQPMTLATAQATTSGTSKDFTSIPSWVKRITVAFSGVSTNGTSLPIIQLGDSGGIEATGYTSAVAVSLAGNTTGAGSATTGFNLVSSAAAATTFSGLLTLVLLDAATNTWVASLASASTATAGGYVGGGTKSLSATLDRISLTTVNGTDAFDAGSVNLLYEG